MNQKRIVMSEELNTALTKVLNYLKSNPRGARLDGELSIECAFKYIRVWDSWTILVLLPNGDAFEPAPSNGRRLPNFGRPVGNIVELVKQPNWQKQVRFVTGEFNYPVTISFGQKRTPCLCGRTDNLKQTVLGLRCNYCRGADVRHMNSVRQLGGMPRVGDNLIRSKSDYYKNNLG